MADGLDLGASALTHYDQWYDAVAGNISARTPGSKQSIISSENIPEEGATFGEVIGTPKTVVARDFTQGPIVRTGIKTNVAIRDDEGFFSLDNGSVFTRNGDFHWNNQNTLVSSLGVPVDGDSGPIVRDPSLGEVFIDPKGNVHQGDTIINKIAVHKITERNQLKLVPGGFELAGEAMSEKMDAVSIVPDSLENANTSSVNSMSDLIRISRSQQTMSRIISQFDQVYAQAIQHANQL